MTPRDVIEKFHLVESTDPNDFLIAADYAEGLGLDNFAGLIRRCRAMARAWARDQYQVDSLWFVTRPKYEESLWFVTHPKDEELFYFSSESFDRTLVFPVSTIIHRDPDDWSLHIDNHDVWRLIDANKG